MLNFLDRKDVKELVNQSPDFIRRRYGSIVMIISFCILIATFAIALNVHKVLYEIYLGTDMVLSSDVRLIIIFMAVIGVAVTGFLLEVIYKQQSLLTAIEFQSAMFSSAVRANTTFVLIANSNDILVYADRDAISIFSEKYLNSVKEFLDNNIVSENDRKNIRDAIAAGKLKEFPITYKDANSQEKVSLISITPIDKPKGYFSMKGYEYHPKNYY